MATNRQLLKVEPAIWRACAGTSVHIPAVNSRVYYFPQGHSEQSASTPTFSPLVFARPYTLCCVRGVGFFANPETDEVFAKMHLVPVPSDQSVLLRNEQVILDIYYVCDCFYCFIALVFTDLMRIFNYGYFYSDILV